MRILFTSWPAWGHLYPMYPTARAALQRGHEVVFASADDVADGLRRDGFLVWSVGPTLAQAVAARPPTALSDQNHRRTWIQRVTSDVEEMFGPAGARRAEELLPLAEAWRPDLVVHGAGDASGLAVAAVLERPSIMHGLSLMPPGFAALIEPTTRAAADRFGLTNLDREIEQHPVLDLTPASLLPSDAGNLPSRQPLRPSLGEVEPDPAVVASLAQALDALPYERTVYLTLGTIMNNAPGVMQTALAGILNCAVNVVVTTGPGSDPQRLGELPPHVLVRRHIGQATVLPFCSAVVSHAGSGTMLGALGSGLPQLALPMGADQPLNAATLERVGAGLRIDPDGLTAAAVEVALARLLDESSFTESAQRLASEIADMPTAAEVWAVLEGQIDRTTTSASSRQVSPALW